VVVNEWATGALSIIASLDAIVGSCSSWGRAGRDGGRGSAAIHHDSKAEPQLAAIAVRWKWKSHCVSSWESVAAAWPQRIHVQCRCIRQEKEGEAARLCRNRGGRRRGESMTTGHCLLVQGERRHRHLHRRRVRALQWVRFHGLPFQCKRPAGHAS